MRKLRVFIALAFTLHANAEKPIDVYLIGGQSNATGQGYLRNLPPAFNIDERVMIFHSGNHLKSGAAAMTWHPLRQASESPDRFGPELGFGNAMQQRNPNQKIALIKHAWSGTNLHTQWNPKTPGAQYSKFVSTVHAGLEGLRTQGYRPTILGMLWQQGESDAKNKETASAYAENLSELIHAVRTEFQAPEMLFVFGEVLPKADYKKEDSPAAILRKQQKLVSENACSYYSTRGARLVKTNGLSLRKDDKDSPHPTDVVHFGTQGTLELGQRFARTMIEGLDSRPQPAPEVVHFNDGASLTAFLPAKDKATGRAVVICPGGGYGGICTHTEGRPIAKLLNERGIAGLVLKYRLPHGDAPVPGTDAKRAISLARERAADWGFSPDKVGIWGFSAGGHLAATVGTLGRGKEQPNFQILFYPVISMDEAITHRGSRERLLGLEPSSELIKQYSLEKQVHAKTPSTFILHAASDGAVPAENSLRYYQALLDHKIPAVLHLYQAGGHGPGAFKHNPSWEAAFDEWLSNLK